MVIEREHEIELCNGNDCRPVTRVGPPKFGTKTLNGIISESDKKSLVDDQFLADNICYTVRVKFPSSDKWVRQPEGGISFGNVNACTDRHTDTDTGTGTDTGTEQDTHTVSDNDNDSDTVIGSDTIVDTPSDSTDSATDTQEPEILKLEAECVFNECRKENTCANQSGTSSNLILDQYGPDPLPRPSENCSYVDYLVPGTSFQIDGIDFTPYRSMTVRIRSEKPQGIVRLYLDNVELVAEIDLSRFEWESNQGDDTDGFRTLDAELILTSRMNTNVRGPHTLYFNVPEQQDASVNMQIDWVELSTENISEWYPHPEECENLGDCAEECWACATGSAGYCAVYQDACDVNSQCANLAECIERCGPISRDAYRKCHTDCLGQYPTGLTEYEDLADCVICEVCTSGCNGYIDNCMEN